MNYLSYNEIIKKIVEELEGIQAPISFKNHSVKEKKLLNRQVSFISDSFESSDGSKLLDKAETIYNDNHNNNNNYHHESKIFKN